MDHNLDATIALLARTPSALNALLRDLPDKWTYSNEGDGTWSIFEVVGHVIHAEHTDWLPRIDMIVQYGEGRAFTPFDRGGHAEEIQGKSLAQLLDEFARVRTENLDKLRAKKFSPADLERRGRHPALGVVTLAQLLATWAAHDMTHLHQISRIMAHQYREAVGPWERYLGVMHYSGHSASS